MLRLYLLRHAKSSWDDAEVQDFDRPLAERGLKAAEAMAAFIAREGYLPAVIACSSARRARQTLQPLIGHLSGEVDIRLTRRIYDADPQDLLDALRATGGTATSLMMIGHNPTFEDLAALLAPGGDGEALSRMRQKFPTAALAVIEFEAARWDEVGPGAGRLVAFHTPKSAE
ncbi:SixA phosphatase family protein [Lutibaculum baratangense]|uniref:Phosphohistidine phosphatase SixA n=1 Tax=Lutibaculum baratangense AMV1 TaxID=631454 RepID=V4RL15_9HYPH|nr:histidine phosphatase family protein [Lutibaculum baratangense]ESR26756.1 hypothetical protein N177_0540 [Lutibaculum baratangense AMV1]